MEYWYDIIRSYDDPKSRNPEKKNHGIYSQSSAAILLIYLAFGDDHAFNIIKYFENRTFRRYISKYREELDQMVPEINEEYFMSNLRTHNIYTLLNRMEEDELVEARAGKGKTTTKKVYSINPRVLQSPIRRGTYIKYDGSIFEYPLELVKQLFPLKNMQLGKDKSYRGRDAFFKYYIFRKNINFITFMGLLWDWMRFQRLKKDSPLVKILEDYWAEVDSFIGDNIIIEQSTAQLIVPYKGPIDLP